MSSVDRIVHVAYLALWFLSAWYASDGWTERRQSPADRLKNLIVFIVTELFVLGALRMLYPAAIVAVGVACAVARTLAVRRSRSARPTEAPRSGDPMWIVPMAVSIVIGWPGLVRPLLDGDSLSYHLPNAAAWVHAHSFWTTSTSYWWYPPTSELFAAGVYAVGGPATLGLSGFVAVLLLAFRITEFAREARFRPLEAAAIACAIVTVPTIALQTGSLQNDVWLTALLLECYWAVRTVGVTSPFGPSPHSRNRSARSSRSYSCRSRAVRDSRSRPLWPPSARGCSTTRCCRGERSYHSAIKRIPN